MLCLIWAVKAVDFLGPRSRVLKLAIIPRIWDCVTERVCEIVPSQGYISSAHIRTMRYMGKRRNRVCGADIHNELIVATIQCSDDTTLREEFGTTRSELARFKAWVISNGCEQVAFEATGAYWFPVYDVLSPSIDTVVGNPWMIKGLPKDKSDDHDSKSIASFCLNGQIKRSRVFSNDDRDLRTMTRAGQVTSRRELSLEIEFINIWHCAASS
jgi:hypothetical protein